MLGLRKFSRIPMTLSVLGTVLAPTAALAVTWNSSSNPLTAYESGVAQAQAYGNFYNTGSYARSSSNQRDPRPGGDSVYVDTQFYFYQYSSTACGSSGGTCYVYYGHEETSRTNTNSWDSQYKQKALPATGQKARGKIHVCEDQSFSGDPCSDWVLPTFAY